MDYDSIFPMLPTRLHPSPLRPSPCPPNEALHHLKALLHHNNNKKIANSAAKLGIIDNKDPQEY